MYQGLPARSSSCKSARAASWSGGATTWGIGVALLLAGCGTEVAESSEPLATTHALLRVERTDVVGGEAEATGSVFAGIMRVPAASDPEPLLRLSSKGLTLPAAGQCLSNGREPEATLTSNTGRVEFLEAGDVSLRVSDNETLLAPKLFGFQAELTGMAYTSRDRAAEPPPGGASYVLKTTGSDQLPALELSVAAPELLSDVSLADVALAEVSEVSTNGNVAVGWRAGDSRDLVYVEVTSAGEGTLGVCAFKDADGRGVLPRGLFGASGGGGLSFHRFRAVAADVGTLDAAEVRFDFELTAEVSFR